MTSSEERTTKEPDGYKAADSEQGVLWEKPGFEPPVERYPAAFLKRPEKAPHIRSMTIEALKGIDKIEIILSPPLTILTGPNNSGKSTILQAVLLGFDVFRRCVDTSSWTIRSTGRALQELDFLRVNEPKDLWFKQIWKPAKDRERYIRVGFTFDNGFHFTARVRYLYGALNVGIEDHTPNPSQELVGAIVSSAPILITPSPGPQPHEAAVSLAQLHYTLGAGDPARVLHNVLLQLHNAPGQESWGFVRGVLRRHFGVELEQIKFDEKLDLEIRTAYSESGYSLDIVSAGSGLNQILQLAAVVAWRQPGIVLLDEPDAHLHSTLQTRMLDFLYDLAGHYGIQVILSTHSREIISQAPLQAIVPVDLSRTRLEPMASLEHLLLEFERQGAVSNVDIALLYQTKKCLFVEGPTENKLVPKLAQRLGKTFFTGRNQIVMFEFEGVENLKLVPKVVGLFERMIGAKLSWGVLRDRDANLPEVIEEYRSEATQKGIANLFIWDSYSLENQLLDPGTVQAALAKKYPESALSVEQVRDILAEAAKLVDTEVGGAYITKAQAAYRMLGKENPFEKGAADAYKFVSSLNSLELKLKYYPGKKLFGQLVQLLQDRHKQTLRLDDLVETIDATKAPDGLLGLSKMLSSL